MLVDASMRNGNLLNRVQKQRALQLHVHRALVLLAKARQEVLEARIAQLDNVEAARKEAERARLRAVLLLPLL